MKEKVVNDQRRLWKYIVFGLLTAGIYDLIFMWKLCGDLNISCGEVEETDDDRSPNYLIVVLLTIITLGIYNYVWFYKQGNRIKTAGKQYGIPIEEKGSTYILWQILGLWLFGIGPIIALYLFIGNLNKICRACNKKHATKSIDVPPVFDNPVNKPSYEREEPARYDDTYGKTSGGFDRLPAYYSWDTIPSKPQGTIKGVSGFYNGAEVTLADGDEIVIGRNSSLSQLVIPDSNVSRKHCSIRYHMTEGCYYVTDFSSNGTIMNDSEKLPSNRRYRCPIGTKITLGNGNNSFMLM